MKPNGLLAASLCGILALAASFLPSSAAIAASRTNAPNELALVRYIYRGLAVTPPGGSKEKGVVKMSLFQSYALRTEHSQKASIGFHDGTVVHLNQNTDAVLANPHETRVRKGEIAQYLAPGTNHQVHTDAAIATATGTTFDVQVSGSTTTFVVLHGALQVSNPSGAVLVKSNHQSVVPAGKAPAAPTAVDARRVFAWTDGIPSPDLGEDVSLDANGGKVVEFSSQREGAGDEGHAFHVADGLLSQGWETATGKVANQFVKISFHGGNFYRISDVIIDPAATYGEPASEDLKDFEIRVSSTDTKDESFTTVFHGTCKQKAELQRFSLPVPVRAKHIEVVALNNYGSKKRIAVAEFEAVATSSLFAQPNGIAVDPKGFIYIADTNANRIDKLSPKGKIVAKWGTKGSKRGQFLEPRGVAVDKAGNIYVADSQNSRVQKLSPQGKPLLAWGRYGIQNDELAAPQGIAVDGKGNVYIADTFNSRIKKYSSKGKLLDIFGGLSSTLLSLPEGLVVDEKGTMAIADTGHDQITVLDASGKELGTIGGPGDKPGEFKEPTGIALDAQGNLFVADSFNSRIQKLDTNTGKIAVVGQYGFGPGDFFLPSGVALDKQGNVYVADRYNSRVQKLSNDLKLKAVWGKYATVPQVLGKPGGIAVDPHGLIYITDHSNHRVQVRDSKGHVRAVLGYHGFVALEGGTKGLGQFNLPLGITIDKQGEIYVADSGNNRIQLLAPSGPIDAFGSSGVDPGQMLGPSSVAVDAQGNIYVAEEYNPRIDKFSSTGTFLASFKLQANPSGTFFFPEGLALDSKGNMYVVSGFDDRVQKLAPNGDIVAVWGKAGSGPRDDFYGPTGITVDQNDVVYVADSSHGVIRKLTTEGKLLSTFVCPGRSANPVAVAVDRKGTLYVADDLLSQIDKISATGKVLAIWR